jgi:hypothetical protein
VFTPNLGVSHRYAVAAVLLLCSASLGSAQTIVDAQRVEFLPSPDDGLIDDGGAPVVDRYAMDIFVAGDTTAVETLDLGKPAPDLDGYIRVDFGSLLSVPLTPGISYEATVAAIGPGGTTASVRSNTFGVSSPCSFSITPPTASFDYSASTGSFSVSTGTGCEWTAVSQASWVVVSSGAQGTGPGSVSFSVAANPNPATRSATILAAGSNFNLSQAAAPQTCAYSLSSDGRTVSASATSLTVDVITAANCPWTAASPVSWVVVSSGTPGTGSGPVTLLVSKNTSSRRTATLTIAGRSFVLTQKSRRR